MTTIIGIDPGQRTGVAIYRSGELCDLRTIAPMEFAAILEEIRPHVVMFEDSRLIKPIFRRGTNPLASLKIARNVGEIDRLCRDIMGECERRGIPAISVSPKGKGSKRNAAQFKALTGWLGRSNQHERDAAMVAWPSRRMVL